jgi:hypothetical protein
MEALSPKVINQNTLRYHYARLVMKTKLDGICLVRVQKLKFHPLTLFLWINQQSKEPLVMLRHSIFPTEVINRNHTFTRIYSWRSHA